MAYVNTQNIGYQFGVITPTSGAFSPIESSIKIQEDHKCIIEYLELASKLFLNHLMYEQEIWSRFLLDRMLHASPLRLNLGFPMRHSLETFNVRLPTDLLSPDFPHVFKQVTHTASNKVFNTTHKWSIIKDLLSICNFLLYKPHGLPSPQNQYNNQIQLINKYQPYIYQ